MLSSACSEKGCTPLGSGAGPGWQTHALPSAGRSGWGHGAARNHLCISHIEGPPPLARFLLRRKLWSRGKECTRAPLSQALWPGNGSRMQQAVSKLLLLHFLLFSAVEKSNFDITFMIIVIKPEKHFNVNARGLLDRPLHPKISKHLMKAACY